MAPKPRTPTNARPLTDNERLVLNTRSQVALDALTRHAGIHGKHGRAEARRDRQATRRRLAAGDFDQ